MDIRRVSSDEWKLVREVRLAALRDTPDRFWATYDDEVGRPESWWRNFIEAGSWFVAYDDQGAIGIAAAVLDPELAQSERQLISMSVAPEARGRGVGAMLLEAVKASLRDNGVAELQLEVTEGNEKAVRLYERCGFRRTGRATPHPRDQSLREFEMRLRL